MRYLDSLFPPTHTDRSEWCGAESDEVDSAGEKVCCARYIRHSGPHRYFDGGTLHLWFDGHEEEELLLGTLVKPELPVPESITKLRSP